VAWATRFARGLQEEWAVEERFSAITRLGNEGKTPRPLPSLTPRSRAERPEKSDTTSRKSVTCFRWIADEIIENIEAGLANFRTVVAALGKSPAG
jgi:hypothetical protein